MAKRFLLLALLIAVSSILFLGSHGTVESQSCRLLATTGRVEWIRVNDVGTGFGPSDDFIDGEVIFKLTNGDNRYGYPMRNNGNSLVAQGGLSLLLEAMRNGWSVEVDYNDCGGRNHAVGFGRIRVFR